MDLFRTIGVGQVDRAVFDARLLLRVITVAASWDQPRFGQVAASCNLPRSVVVA